MEHFSSLRLGHSCANVSHMGSFLGTELLPDWLCRSSLAAQGLRTLVFVLRRAEAPPMAPFLSAWLAGVPAAPHPGLGASAQAGAATAEASLRVTRAAAPEGVAS